MDKPQRTGQQNKALHKYCAMLADELNGAGLNIRETLRNDFDIPWTPATVKELLWRPVQQVLTGKTSTTEIDTVEPSEIYDVLNINLAEKFGVSVEWPHLDNT